MAIIKNKLLLILLTGVLLSVLFSCDEGLAKVKYEIAGIPNKIIYIANVDNELDLSGIKAVATDRDGCIEEIPFAPTELDIVLTTKDGRTATTEAYGGIEPIHVESEDFSLNRWQVIHKIDFTTPGVYEVRIYHVWRDRYDIFEKDEDRVVSYKFFVQVVDEDYIDSIINQK
ncbi:MAG: hypothetical protein FWF15_04460 [Oscillospiraceae bacterium]|nr:hypothetical protein [Oscillospiraceae bacterium]